MISETYDVAIIGGGHNGLITAAYLAKGGKNVVVFEKKERTGGIAVTEELFPGFKVSSLVDGSNSFSPEVSADLGLARFGLDIIANDLSGAPLIFAPQEDGKHLTIWHDVQQTAREISQFSQADADAYPLFIEKMRKISQIIAVLNRTPLPDMPDVGFKDMLGMLKLVKPIRALGWKNIIHMARVLSLSVSDLLNEWFESDSVKATIAASALNNISLGPQESGTAYAFLQNFSTSNNSLFRSSGQIVGGMGSLTRALADSAKSFGAEIITGAEVSHIIVRDGRTSGVQLADGITVEARSVVSATDMRTTFLHLVEAEHLDESVMNRVRTITYNGTMARVHFALNTLPNFAGLDVNAEQMLKGHIQISPSIIDLQKAFDPVKYGQFSKKPYLDIQIPSLNDPALAPAGKHLMSVTVKYMPYRLREGNWQDLRDSLASLVINTISAYAPDFAQCVQDSHVITPLDMETDYNLPEGSLTHGDTTLDQALWMRPLPGYAQYNSPIQGLYLCSASTHPGAGVTGINGANAARSILKGTR
jgi:phytoene dehydrogenase-like protein